MTLLIYVVRKSRFLCGSVSVFVRNVVLFIVVALLKGTVIATYMHAVYYDVENNQDGMFTVYCCQ